jgi:hypothetical protein
VPASSDPTYATYYSTPSQQSCALTISVRGRENVAHLTDAARFELVQHDVTNALPDLWPLDVVCASRSEQEPTKACPPTQDSLSNLATALFADGAEVHLRSSEQAGEPPRSLGTEANETKNETANQPAWKHPFAGAHTSVRRPWSAQCRMVVGEARVGVRLGSDRIAWRPSALSGGPSRLRLAGIPLVDVWKCTGGWSDPGWLSLS